MLDIFKYFDFYGLKARVFPALLAGTPALAFASILIPWDHLGLPHAIAGALSFVLLFAFADVARRTGKQLQAKLGTAVTPHQWHRDDQDIAAVAKDRYRDFMARQLKRRAPTANEERSDPRRADDFYLSAGNWLREHTRDKRVFAILFEENVTYGFRRNLRGLKYYALVLDAIIGGLGVAVLYWRWPYFEALQHIDEKICVVILVALVHAAYTLLAVTCDSVREASRAFGRQLILSCETLMHRPS